MTEYRAHHSEGDAPEAQNKPAILKFTEGIVRSIARGTNIITGLVTGVFKARACQLIDCEVLYSKNQHGGVQNAIEHAAISAAASYDLGDTIAKHLGDLKENLGMFTNNQEGSSKNENERDTKKDLCNNRTGIALGMYAKKNNLAPEEFARLIIDAVNQGTLDLGVANSSDLFKYSNVDCNKEWRAPSLQWTAWKSPRDDKKKGHR